jgi:AI-2 transport protein TqsA
VLSPALRALLTAAALVIVMAGLRAAATILVPMALALFVAVVSLPLLDAVRRRGVPGSLAVPLVVLMDIGALIGMGWLVTRAFGEVRVALPQYLLRLRELEQSARVWLAGRGVELGGPATDDLVNPERIFAVLTALFRGVTDVMTLVFLVLLITVFILSEASSFPAKLRAAMGGADVDTDRWAKVVGEVQHYLAIKTLVSVATGVVIGTSAWLMNVDFALLWGLLAFVLNYIPSIGSILAAIPAVLVAMLQHGTGTALALVMVFLAVNALFGNLVEPAVLGRRLGLSTLVVITSILFWGWLWGPVGMFLAVPLTMTVKIVLENVPDFRWLAILMASPPSAASESLDPQPGAAPRGLERLEDPSPPASH